MKVVTICQPWAWAISAGHKTVENRTWAPSYRGPILIHAGSSMSWMKSGLEFLRSIGIEPDERDLLYGRVIALANLRDVLTYGEGDLFHDLKSDPFASGPKCWLLDGVSVLMSPFRLRGRQGIFDIPDRKIELRS